jgi:hypothetical protein
MPLVPHHPSIVTIIAFKGKLKHIGVWDQQFFFHTRHDKSFHYIVLYEPFFSSSFGAYNAMPRL